MVDDNVAVVPGLRSRFTAFAVAGASQGAAAANRGVDSSTVLLLAFAEVLVAGTLLDAVAACPDCTNESRGSADVGT